LAAVREDANLGRNLLAFAGPVVAQGTVLRPHTLHMLGVLANKENKLEDAERYYRLSLRGTSVELRPLMTAGLLRVLWKGRKYAEVVEVCRTALADPKDLNRTLYLTWPGRWLVWRSSTRRCASA